MLRWKERAQNGQKKMMSSVENGKQEWIEVAAAAEES